MSLPRKPYARDLLYFNHGLIGSGEIKSAHCYVIQHRLKIAGAWWKIENAEKMLALRVVRANGDWEKYWAEAAYK